MTDHTDDIPDDPTCPVCGGSQAWVQCWNGCNEGWFDEADNDPVNFAPGEEVYPCGECDGEGGYWECVRVPHSESQMEAYYARHPERRPK